MKTGCSLTLTLGINSFMSYLWPLSLLLQPACCCRKRERWVGGRWAAGCWRGGGAFISSPTSKELLLKVKPPSESWQPLVGISIPAAASADCAEVVPHSGSARNLPQRGGPLWCHWLMLSSARPFICTISPLGRGSHSYLRQRDLWSAFFCLV